VCFVSLFCFYSPISSGVRPFGVSILIGGYDVELQKPVVFQCDPSVSIASINKQLNILGGVLCVEGNSIGKEQYQCKDVSREAVCYILFIHSIFISYTESLDLDDAVHCALLTLKESFDVGMTEDNVELAVCNAKGFQRMSKQQIRDHLATL
jgi:20S proteasome subunit alpha 2